MQASGGTRFHVAAWLAWLMSGMLAALFTRNPIYLCLIIAASALVHRTITGRAGSSTGTALLAQSERERRGLGIFLRFVVVLLVIVTVFKGFSVHTGVTVLFRLPEEWPLIGGPITAEGLTYAGLDALSLLTVLAVFTAFTAGADYYAMLRSVPAFMHQVGLITSIAITFVPQTITRFTEIREAQALRGHRVRRVGDLVPIIIPLLSGGMERSMNLAEAMEARGFSRHAPGTRKLPPLLVQSGVAAGLGLTMTGAAFLAFFSQTPLLGWSTIVGGVALVGATLWAVSAGSRRTRYRRSVWRDTDTLLLVPSLAITAILLLYKASAPGALIYDPLSRLRMYAPPFDLVLGMTLIVLAVPALVLWGNRRAAGAQIEMEASTG
ncbi:MAG: energy-coupling factor transporter transmembrane protein EcfT [Chloroflexota bacterium]|nr:energy-coupling factor transporter transmembrane protein EcfT [Chloroflexota bacterium]MDQ5864933.1 energy-coupling factor transporter transmembrane protein EcfT [Chloroflexota bacterium]